LVELAIAADGGWVHSRTLHRHSVAMPIQAETSDQTTYRVMFGQRDFDNLSW
jgi:hypothetical protein